MQALAGVLRFPVLHMTAYIPYLFGKQSSIDNILPVLNQFSPCNLNITNVLV